MLIGAKWKFSPVCSPLCWRLSEEQRRGKLSGKLCSPGSSARLSWCRGCRRTPAGRRRWTRSRPWAGQGRSSALPPQLPLAPWSAAWLQPEHKTGQSHPSHSLLPTPALLLTVLEAVQSFHWNHNVWYRWWSLNPAPFLLTLLLFGVFPLDSEVYQTLLMDKEKTPGEALRNYGIKY